MLGARPHVMAPINRREFLRRSLLAGAGVAAAGSGASLLAGCSGLGRAKPYPVPPSGRVLADLHVHSSMNDWIARSPLAVRTPLRASIAAREFNPTRANWKDCHKAGVNVMCVAHYNVFDEMASMPTDPNPEAPDTTDLMMSVLEDQLKNELEPYARLARNHEELKAQLRVLPPSEDFRTSVVHAVEGGHALGGRLEAIQRFAQRGVAWMTLTHFLDKGIASAGNALPFFPDDSNPLPSRGLTDFGADVVRACEANGIIVDVTHCTSNAVAEVLDVASKPLLATHASSATLSDRPYGLVDDHIVEIADKGGVIGVILYPYITTNYSDIGLATQEGSLHDVVRTIRYIVKITGSTKHVGIGSDFSGYIQGPREMMRLSEIGKLRDLLLVEFDQDIGMVEDILVNNSTRFLLKNWRSGLST